MYLSGDNNFFEKKNIHKFTWMSGVYDSESLLELIVAQDEDRNKLLDANVFRGVGRAISI